VIEIKCGEGKIVIGEPCPPVQSVTFPIVPENMKEEKGEDQNDAPQSA
jgi:hypothetical protein